MNFLYPLWNKILHQDLKRMLKSTKMRIAQTQPSRKKKMKKIGAKGCWIDKDLRS